MLHNIIGSGLVSPGGDPAPLTVSGTLSPDVTGEYTYGGEFNGEPYWVRDVGGTDWYIWSSDAAEAGQTLTNYCITDTLGTDIDSTPAWGRSPVNASVATGTYNPYPGGATGTATVAE